VCDHCSVVVGETDWKVLAIDVNDSLAQQLNGETLFVLFDN